RGGKMALGILPLGTANDFATSVGIPQDLASALNGGDGTINEVATALVERGGKMALGILPLGTANDFATSVGIPQDLASAL
ncbi:diacylglycerol kinase family protein, partial [Escherichia coli]|uniref:diacylglycerol kinase family protein n=1 Tax=Escherichia coli TaxID=562 RepID=UPI00259D1651